MANSFLKAEKIAATALGLLERELVLSQLVWTNHGFDFTGAKNDTVTVRVPARMTAREFDWREPSDTRDTVVTDTLSEDSLTVTLNHDYYTAVAVTDEQMTLDIADFGSQVLLPQVRAVADKLDSGVASMITGATYNTTIYDVSDTDPWVQIVAARRALNTANVQRDGRVLLVGADIEDALIKSDRLADVSQSGSDGALRDATIGRVAGFNVVGSNAIPAGEAYAFVPSAFALCTRAPIVPAGVPFGQSTAYAGYAMRWIRDYDPTHLQDRSVVNAYVGYNVMTDQETPGDASSDKLLLRAVKLTTAVAPAG